MKISITLQRWIYKNYEWQTLIGVPLVEVTGPREYLVEIRSGDETVCLSRRQLKAALEALDMEVK